MNDKQEIREFRIPAKDGSSGEVVIRFLPEGMRFEDLLAEKPDNTRVQRGGAVAARQA